MTGADPRPTIQEWLGGEPFPWPGIDELEEGVRTATCYGVESKQLLRTKDDKPYLRLQLCDRSGAIEGRVWEEASRVDARIAAGDFVGVRGRVQSFRGQRQLKVEEIEPLAVGADELDLFLPRTPHDLEALDVELDARIASIADPHLAGLLDRLLGRNSESGRAFRRAPAAKRNHHAYVGGLLEHTLSIAGACDLLADHYGPAIDRDLLLAGALVHDIGKIREIGVSIGFPYTDPGKLLGHIVLGIELVRDAAREIPGLSGDRLLLLLHLIASHQGRYEWQSPKIPMTLEALLLHYVDDLDAKMNQAMALIAAVSRGWTPYDGGFGREFLRHRDEGGEAGPAVGFGSGRAQHASVDPHTPSGSVLRSDPDGDDRVRRPPVPAGRPAPEQAAPDADTLDLFGG